ncbi:hypothetical protein O3P69_017008 [Scylla paramamosain]|uniref:Uncharacterized protein n=1 Tax=Scylla paramamosain TaxID=85552 RepID=A0AAW0TU47_SCYPA
MLRSLCRLTAHSRVVTCALRPAVQATPLETFSALLRASATVSSQNLACQYSTGVRQTTHLSLKGVSGFQPANTKYGVMPILTNLAPLALPSAGATPSRSVVKWSWKKGKRKTVKPVLKRFKRLHWHLDQGSSRCQKENVEEISCPETSVQDACFLQCNTILYVG